MFPPTAFKTSVGFPEIAEVGVDVFIGGCGVNSFRCRFFGIKKLGCPVHEFLVGGIGGRKRACRAEEIPISVCRVRVAGGLWGAFDRELSFDKEVIAT